MLVEIFFALLLLCYTKIMPDLNTLTIAVFQNNASANIESNKKQLLQLIDHSNAHEADCWSFPECVLFRPQSDHDVQSFSLEDTIITWFQDLAKNNQKP